MHEPNFSGVRLGDVCRLVTDGSHFSPTPQVEGHPIVNAKDMPNGRIVLSSCTKISESDWALLKMQNCAPEAGDVLLSKDGTIGRVVHYREDLGVVLLSSVAILRPNGTLDSEFLAQSLRSHIFDSQLFRLQSGSALKRLVLSDIRKIEVPQPPTKVQQRIAEILSTVDEAIEQTEALIAKTQQIKAGLMHDLFTRGVTPDGQLRPPREEAPQLYKESPLGWIPKEWEVERLGRILRQHGGYLQTGPFGSQLHAHEYEFEGVPVVMPQNIKDGQICEADIARISADRANDLLRHRMRPGDIVIARRGDLSRAATISKREEGWLCGTGCFLLCLGNSELEAKFASYAYQQHLVQRQIAGRAVGTTMQSLNNTVMSQLWFPFCRPEEQRTLVERLDAVEQQESVIAVELEVAQRLKRGLMHDLLTGRVQVPQTLIPSPQPSPGGRGGGREVAANV